MTTDQATPTEQTDVTSTLEGLTPADGDRPLIEQEAPADQLPGDTPLVEQGQDQQAEEATETDSDGAAASDQEVKDTETSEPEQKPDESPSATLTREEHDAELSKVRSGLDKRIAEIEKAQQEEKANFAQREAQLQAQLSQQNFQAQVAAYQSQLAADYEARGESPENAQRLATEQTKQSQAAYEYALQNQELQRQLNERTSSEETTNARVSARELAAEHGVHDDDIPLLMEAKSVESMTSLAKRLGGLNKQTQEISEKKLAEVPNGANNDLDSGGGAAGAMTDRQKWAAYGAGDLDLSLEDAIALQTKLGMVV